MLSPWTFDQVRDRLLEAVELAWRSDSSGRWPFASDGPWHLCASELYGPDVDKDAPAPRIPLSKAEVAQRDTTLAWLTWVPEADRRLVVLALKQQAAPRFKRMNWARIRRQLVTGPGGLEVAISDRGLGMRYSRALTAIAKRLTADQVAH